jgi:endonuclease G
VAVPNYFYKILVYKTKGDFNMIGFLVPHNESKLPLYKFVVPVDKIEKMTAIDFFQNWMIKLKTD